MKGHGTSLRALAIAALFAGVWPASVAAQAVPFDAMYSFGDSLSDTGNTLAGTEALGMTPAVPPSESPHRTYYDGRFSNGPVAIEYLWQRLTGHAPGTRRGVRPIMTIRGAGSSRAIDFSFGGTGTDYLDRTPGGFWAPGLKGQVELYRAARPVRRPARRALYVIATGSNDYRADDFNVPSAPPEVVGNILEAVATLYDLGARDVMVFDLPDPAFLPGGDPDGSGSSIALQHNELLGRGLARLAAERPGLRLIPVHLNELYAHLPGLGFEVITPALALLFPDPGAFGVPVYQCLFVLPEACQDAGFDVVGQLGMPFVYWDVVHPTTEAHRVLAQYLFDLVTQADGIPLVPLSR